MTDDPLYARFGREFQVGDVLFHEGDVGEVMYVIREGRVHITRTLGGVVRTVAFLGRGEFFGELSILNGKPRNATATVTETLHALEIDARTFESMISGNGEIAVKLITRLARRLDSAGMFIEILQRSDPGLRVAMGLARVAEEWSGVGDANGGSRVPLTAVELAPAVGLGADEVSRVLKRLCAVRVIRADADTAGTWVVPDLGALHAFIAALETRRAPSTVGG